MRISPITQNEALAWCKEELAKDQQNRSKENQEKLVDFFQQSGKRNWFAVTDLILLENPTSLSEDDVIKFCRARQQTQPTLERMHENTAKALQQIYILSINNNWPLVKGFLLANKLVNEESKKLGEEPLPTTTRPRRGQER